MMPFPAHGPGAQTGSTRPRGITIQSSSSSSVRSTMIQGSASRGTTRPGPWTPDEELAFPQRFLSFMRS